MKYISKIFESLLDNTSEKFDIELYKIYKHGKLTWLQPALTKSPTFLKIYSANTFKAKLFKFIVTCIWYLRLQSLFFSKVSIKYSVDSVFSHLIQYGLNDMAIFSGTVGDNRKAVIYGCDNNDGYFCKVPIADGAYELVEHERKSLHYLEQLEIKSVIVPKIVDLEMCYLISDVSFSDSRPYICLDEHAIVFAEEMYMKSADEQPLKQLLSSFAVEDQIRDIDYRLPNLKNGKLKSEISSSLERVRELMRKDCEISVTCSFGHGDFTPWNSFLSKNGLSVIDWEMARKYPLYFDLIHHIVAKNALVGEFSAEPMIIELNILKKKMFNYSHLSNQLRKFSFYVRLYALINTVYYCRKFSLQDQDIHHQAYTLIDAWRKLLNYD